MQPIHSTTDLWGTYPFFKHKHFAQRYLPLEKVEKTLFELSEKFNLKTEGFSVLKKPIRSVYFGNGTTKILMWSQMHGNETTTTKAVVDLLQFFEAAENHPLLQEILCSCTIKIVPVLNMDGAEVYTRENANKIDLNRDAKKLSQPESRLLDKVFKEFQPDFCFNLHDQRSLYSVGSTNKSAVVSFLAPSVDSQKTISPNRKTSMQLIAEISALLQQHIPGHTGRYDDTFNPNCVGDKFQSFAATLLFEAGHFPEDYQREQTRKLIFVSIIKALEQIAKKNYSQTDPKEYTKIPENQKLFFDFVLRNVLLNNQVTDIGIHFEEHLIKKKIRWVPVVKKIGDLSGFYGHKEYKGEKEKIQINRSRVFKEGGEIRTLTINGKIFGLI